LPHWVCLAFALQVRESACISGISTVPVRS
jgi:hypothetical protein